MARIDKGLVILVGRDRENPRTHREAFEITDGLGELLDKHIKWNNLNKSEFIREAVAAKLEAEMPKEPLIKDKKIRKAVKAMADITGVSMLYYAYYEDNGMVELSDMNGQILTFKSKKLSVEECESYTIKQLCGEEEE